MPRDRAGDWTGHHSGGPGVLDDPVVDRLPTAGRLVRLRDGAGDARLEAACARALRYDDRSYSTIKRILAEGLDAEEASQPLAFRRPRPSCAVPPNCWGICLEGSHGPDT